MKVIKWSNALYIMLIIAAITSVVVWLLHNRELSLGLVWKCIGCSVTVISIITTLFCSKLWKLRLFQGWLVLIPNIEGEWEGTLLSNWVNPVTKKRVPKIHAKITIKQSLFTTSCILCTKESSSRSLCCNFEINKEEQIQKLLCIYRNEPKQAVQDRSQMHMGSMVLNITNKDNCLVMEGCYWTARNTNGDMEFRRIKK